MDLSIEKLLNEGFSFKLDRIYSAPFSKVKTRTFVIKPIVLAVLTELSEEYLKMDMNESLITADANQEVKILTRKHAYKSCRVIALAVAGNSIFRSVTIPFLTNYFLMRIDSAKLSQLTALVHHLSNYPDFVSAIRYSSAARTTAPEEPIDTPEEDAGEVDERIECI
jgi:hypothetical protein